MFTIPKSSAFVWVVDHQTWGGLWLFELEPHHILRKKCLQYMGFPGVGIFRESHKEKKPGWWFGTWNFNGF
jgi:hypothetical protein